MLVPYRHVADYTELAANETAEIAGLTAAAMTTLRTVSGAQGFNIGINQGDIAGAGIAAHLHQHVVPRWGGDTNFMPVVGRTGSFRSSCRTPGPCSPKRGLPRGDQDALSRGLQGDLASCFTVVARCEGMGS